MFLACTVCKKYLHSFIARNVLEARRSPRSLQTTLHGTVTPKTSKGSPDCQERKWWLFASSTCQVDSVWKVLHFYTFSRQVRFSWQCFCFFVRQRSCKWKRWPIFFFFFFNVEAVANVNDRFWAYRFITFKDFVCWPLCHLVWSFFSCLVTT